MNESKVKLISFVLGIVFLLLSYLAFELWKFNDITMCILVAITTVCFINALVYPCEPKTEIPI